MILANHAEKEANFLDINITREATSSQVRIVFLMFLGLWLEQTS